MAGVTPDSVIRLLIDVPIDKGYKNTIWFDNAEQQTNYFINKTTACVMNQSMYVRVSEGRLRINVNADTIRKANYIMFQNHNYLNKWFYAFIDEPVYINDNCCEVNFTIDVVQTWLFDHLVLTSYVLREHTETDNRGDNIQPENVELGEYMTSYESGTGLMNDYFIIVFSAEPVPEVWHTERGIVGGIYTGLYANIFGMNDLTVLHNYLDRLVETNNQDSVVSIKMFPADFCRRDAQTDKPVFKEVYAIANINNLGGYYPRNKKLLTYPYNLLNVYTGDGNSRTYRYEFFNTLVTPDTDTPQCHFVIKSCFASSEELILQPVGYLGYSGANISESLNLGNFPQCAFLIDTYRAWLAQNKTSLFTKGLISTASAIGGALTLNPASFSTGTLGIVNLISNMVDAQNQPTISKGSQSGTISVANRDQDFHFACRNIMPEFARKIDDYFDMFGYAINEVKVPNRSSRPCWNYVQTVNCNLRGNVSSAILNELKNIYDAGITFWKLGANNNDTLVGMYKNIDGTPRDNSPV